MAKIVKNRGEYVVNVKEFIASSIEDMNAISLTSVASGSKCFVLDGFETYVLSGDNQWALLPETGSIINPEQPEIDLTGYATEEWVNAKIALILDNPTLDIDSISELAKVLEEGGADLVEIRRLLESLTSLVNTNKIDQDNKNELFAQADKLLTQSIKNEVLAREEADSRIENQLNEEINTITQINNQQQAQLNEHAHIIDQIKLGEAMYRAQEVSPVDTNDKSYSLKYDGATFNAQRRTENNIVAVRLEGDDIVLRKLSGDSIQAEEITYNHSVAGQEIITNDNRQKPLYLIGLDNYATSASGYKIILDNNNNGIAATSDCSDLNWKDEYAKVTPCFKIVDYYYEIVYTNKVPTSLKLLGGFFRKDENDAWTMAKVGSFTDTMHQFHIAFEGNQVIVSCPTWTECNGTYNFIEVPEKGISIEGTDKFSFVPTETGYKFTVKNLYHSANIDALNGEYDVEIRQYDAWHEGHMPNDNPYISPINVEYDKVINPCAYPRYYFVKNNDRVLFYKAYNESWGWKSGPFGMAVTNGEFDKTTNINNPNAAVVKYMIDGNLLITGAYEIQEVTLDELAAGRGQVITGVTPYAVNPGTGWGTSDPAVTDNNKRLGMFSYLSNSHDLEKDSYVHPVGNYNVCKLENLPVYTVDGEDVRFLEATVRGFETSLHGEHWEPDSENGRLYIQFICGRTAQEGKPFRVFYRTLTVGYERNEDGKLSTRRKTWSPLTEITTNVHLNKLVQQMQAQFEAVYEEIKTINYALKTESETRESADNTILETAKEYTVNKVGELEKHLNEDYLALSNAIIDIKQPVYFDEYTTEDKIYNWSDIYRMFRKSNRGIMNEKVYIHAWVDSIYFADNANIGFTITDGNGNDIKVTEFKGVFLVGPDGIVPETDNKIRYSKIVETTNEDDSSQGGVQPVSYDTTIGVSYATEDISKINAPYMSFVPCVGMTIDVPAFRMNGTTSNRTYEVTTPEDFRKAINEAPAGSTIVVNNNIELNDSNTAAFVINKPLTIVGNGETAISSTKNKKIFEVYSDITLEGLILNNVAVGGRCIDTRIDGITVTIKNCTIKTNNNSSNVQPITIGGYNTDGLTVNIIDCIIDAGKTGYGIVAFVPATVNITGSQITGYAAIYTKSDADGIIFNVIDSKLHGINFANDPTSNFGTIALESNISNFILDGTTVISAEAKDASTQSLIVPRDFNENNIIKINNNLVSVFEADGYEVDNGIVKNPIVLSIEGPDSCGLRERCHGTYSPRSGVLSYEINYAQGTVRYPYTMTDWMGQDGGWDFSVNADQGGADNPPAWITLTLSYKNKTITKEIAINN